MTHFLHAYRSLPPEGCSAVLRLAQDASDNSGQALPFLIATSALLPCVYTV